MMYCDCQKVILILLVIKKYPGCVLFKIMVQKLFRSITEKIPAVDRRVDGRKMHLEGSAVLLT